jgi:site-specific recombinase XerD
MIAAYLEHLQAEGYSKSTLVAAKRWLKYLELHFNGCLGELKASDLTDFQQSLRWKLGPQGKLYSENSINQAVDVLRGFYRWATLIGLVPKDPTAHLLTRRAPRKAHRELTATEARKLLFHPDPATFHGCRNRAILGLALETRASCGAMARMDLEHFQADIGAILLQGRKREIVSLSDGLCDDLSLYLRQARPGVAKPGEKAFFVSQRGRRMVSKGFHGVIVTHAQGAGVPSPYSFS